MITDYDFDSPDAKWIIYFLGEMYFDTSAKGKSSGDQKLIKIYYNKRTSLTSGLQKVSLLSENTNKICDRICLMIQQKQAGIDTNWFDDKIIAIIIAKTT